MSAPQMTNPTSDASQERRAPHARVAALLLRALSALVHNRLLAVVVLCGTGMIGLCGVLVGYRLLTSPRAHWNADQLVARTLAALEAGDDIQASRAVAQLRRMTESGRAQKGYLPFLIGVAVSHEAAQLTSGADQATLYLVAARYLEEARAYGFPPGHVDEGRYLLATCLFQSGRYDESLPALRAAFRSSDRRKYELARKLSAAYLRIAVPNLTEALHYERLAGEDPALTPRQRDESRLRQGQILMRVGDIPGCRALVAAIAPDSPVRDQALILEARTLIWEGDELLSRTGLDQQAEAAAAAAAADTYRQALEILHRVPPEDLAGVTTIQAGYLIGVCQRRLGDWTAALKSFASTRRQHYGTDESLAATLEEAEILQAQGDAGQALYLYERVIEQAASASSPDSRWVLISELRNRLFRAQHRFRVAGLHAMARDLCDASRTVFPPAEWTEMSAATQEAWGDSLLRAPAGRRRVLESASQAEGRLHLRLAADAYRRLSALRYATSSYPNDLWKSGECFLRGQNYEAALSLFTQYLQTAPRAQHPQAFVALGECHLALGHFHQALDDFELCIQFDPEHPESYRARWLASFASVQLNRTEDAKRLLTDNLENTELSPQSIYWQRSLFTYGDLLFKEAMAREAESRAHGVDSPDAHTRRQGLDYLYAAHNLYLEAIRRLEEAVERYPNAEQTDGAWYAIAESYRHAARLPGKSLAVESEPADRQRLNQQKQAYLMSAADAYRRLQDRLRTRQEQAELSAVEQALLRNADFAWADTLFDLADYEQAIKAYLAVTHHYPQEPVALEAFVQLAGCYRQLSAPAEARGTLLQARAALDRMKPDADFTRTTRYNREEWEQVIGWLAQL